jgi:hypothetical protein
MLERSIVKRLKSGPAGLVEPTSWSRFVALFLTLFVGGIGLVYLFILLIDPYDMVPFSLPLERPILSGAQRFNYPQIVRSKRFDSLIVGSSTARLIDPQQLNGPFEARFANLSMNAMTAWEQMAMARYFLRHAGPPKVLIVALDQRWCDPRADQTLTLHGFPLWMYDDNPWNDYLHLLNGAAVTIALRVVGYRLGLSRERIRYDGYEVFTPPESQYDPTRARRHLWGDDEPRRPPDMPAPALSAQERNTLSFPALAWLERILVQLSPKTLTVLADMPIHVAAQPRPGTHAAAVDAECKARMAVLAAEHRARLIDWRIVSPLTTNDENYWDPLHYRLPIADRLAHELIEAVLARRPSVDGSYRIVVP